MKIKKEHLGKIYRATAENGCTFRVPIEDTPECKKLAKVLKLDIFEKNATKKSDNKPEHNTDTSGEDNA